VKGREMIKLYSELRKERRMKLMTKEIEAKLPPLYSTEGTPLSLKKVAVKFFGGAACTWLIFEGSRQKNGDLLMFGWCDLGMGCPELGYVSLSELEEAKFPPFGLGVERDIYFGNPEFGSLDLL
jgi:hypothetical protein